MKQSVLLALGKAVRHSRQKRGWSQEQLAEKAGLHPNYIGGIERGERNPGYVNLLILSKALEITPALLFNGTERFNLKELSK